MDWFKSQWFIEWEKMAKKEYQGKKNEYIHSYDIELKDRPNNFNNLENKESE